MINVPHIVIVKSNKRRILIQIISHQRKEVGAIAGNPWREIVFGIKPPETVGNSDRAAEGGLFSFWICPSVLFLIEIRHATWGVVLK